MKYVVAIVAFALSLSVAKAEPVLMLNEPRDVGTAEYSCGWAEGEIKQDQYLIKAFMCSESELCDRAININAACKVTGAVADVRAFHTKLLSQFASNPKCAISIMRLTDGKSDAAVEKDLEAYKRANWELNLAFTPGAPVQEWSLWPHESGNTVASGVLEGKGNPAQIARDVCTVMMRAGAKILN
jgi:hypothetical protein